MTSDSIPCPEKLTIGIVGGGNAAHALAALFPHKGHDTYWLADYQDEAEKINQGIAEQGGIKADFAPHNNPKGEIFGTPIKVSKHAVDIVPHCNLLVLPLPSFAYPNVFRDIKPYVRPGMFIAVTPGQGGVDWFAREILGEELFRSIVWFAIMPMPFNCRIDAFGKHVNVQTFKSHYKIAVSNPAADAACVEICERLFGETENVGHFLACTLYPINAIIHPQRLYTLFKDYAPGTVYPDNPLFYEAMTAKDTGLMDSVNAELIQIGKALQGSGLKVDVPHIFDFLQFVYGPYPSLLDMFANNDAYRGFRCPMKQVGGGFVPDFENRYFTEDIPLGLCVYKGIADIVGVQTPVMDTVLAWAQGHMVKEYIVNGRLVGKDVRETSAPQRFGITTLEQLK